MLGEKTRKNLEEAFAGESMARNKYTWYAKVAREAGYVQIANIFEETANHEKEHAKLWAKRLELIGNIEEVLQAAVDGEHHEIEEMYPRMAKEAREEGHNDIAFLFEKVAEAETMHRERYQKLLNNIKDEKVFKREEQKEWKCGNCGYIHTGNEAPLRCPTCAHEQKYFELFTENY
jgi:rubrerythrin